MRLHRRPASWSGTREAWLGRRVQSGVRPSILQAIDRALESEPRERGERNRRGAVDDEFQKLPGDESDRQEIELDEIAHDFFQEEHAIRDLAEVPERRGL